MPSVVDGGYFEQLADAPRPRSWMGEVSQKRLPIAELVVVSGHVVASDPICDMPAVPLALEVPLGRHPVELSILDHAQHGRYVAAAWLLVSREKPGVWTSTTNRNGYDGLAVDSRFACFADESASARVSEDVDEGAREALHRAARSCEHKSGWFEHRFAANAQSGPACNVVGFEAGAGDGAYRVFVGRSARGALLAVVIDFGLLSPHPRPSWW
jgi:hypothetical protein